MPPSGGHKANPRSTNADSLHKDGVLSGRVTDVELNRWRGDMGIYRRVAVF